MCPNIFENVAYSNIVPPKKIEARPVVINNIIPKNWKNCILFKNANLFPLINSYKTIAEANNDPAWNPPPAEVDPDEYIFNENITIIDKTSDEITFNTIFSKMLSVIW